MIEILALRKGGVKCSSACPFYAKSGVVRGYNGLLKTHCRQVMQPYFADCNEFDPRKIEKLEASEEEWQAMQACVGKKAKVQRRLYPEDHKEIHPVGWKPGVNCKL